MLSFTILNLPVSVLMLTQKHKHHHHSRSHMGGGASFNLTFYLFLITLFLILIGPSTLQYAEANDTRETPPPTPPPPPPPPPPGSNGTEKPSSPFKPGIAVVVGVLTTMFSLTFLVLLYIKHCNSVHVNGAGNIGGSGGNPSSRGVPPMTGRKNSGIDRSVIESLPIFRFGSLMGQKDGLDCAVCLTKFEATEVLRLLPKCKHAFHVECVDTWLDAHSTCPLCRYRVDPEDILLVEDTKIHQPIPPSPPQQIHQEEHLDIEKGRNSSQIAETRRVSGRHSSVGEEREGGFLQIITEREQSQRTASFRRSLDSVTARKKNESVGVGVGCFVRPRKDGTLLLTQDTDRDRDRERDRTSVERRLEHRIIVSPSLKSYSGLHHQHQHQMQRWSDVQPSDLLYLTSEMIIGPRQQQQQQQQNMQVPLHWNTGGGRRRMMMMVNNHNNHRTNDDVDEVEEDSWNGRGIINSRSVSEITGLSRFLSVSNNNREKEEEGRHHHQQGHTEERLVSR